MRRLRNALLGLLMALFAAPIAAQEPVVPGRVLQPSGGNSQAFLPNSPTRPSLAWLHRRFRTAAGAFGHVRWEIGEAQFAYEPRRLVEVSSIGVCHA